MKTNKVPFSKIKPGAFFRIKGKTLYQRGKGDYGNIGQVVTGPKIGDTEEVSIAAFSLNTPVTPVNATIVEEK